MAEIEIKDYATPFLTFMAETKPDWMRKALKSTGWRMQQKIKAGIRSKAPGGQAYKDLIPAGIRRRIEGASGKTSYHILGKLVNAVGYEYRAANTSVVVGWLSSSAVKLGSWMEKGVTRRATEKVKQLFWYRDVPISDDKLSIVVPARPTFSPMKKAMDPMIAGWMEEKILQYAESAPMNYATSKRTYRVKGA